MEKINIDIDGKHYMGFLHPNGMISLPNASSVRWFVYDGTVYEFHRNSKSVAGRSYSGRNRREFMPSPEREG